MIPQRVNLAQWAQLLRGEPAELLDRMEPQPCSIGAPIHLYGCQWVSVTTEPRQSWQTLFAAGWKWRGDCPACGRVHRGSPVVMVESCKPVKVDGTWYMRTVLQAREAVEWRAA